MVVVEFAYTEMRKLVDLPREQMVQMLSDLGAPSEYEPELGKIMAELTPNRPDWYSMEGLARALKSYHLQESPKYRAKKSGYVVKVDRSLEKIRPFTACAVVKGLRLDDARVRDMVLLQEKLLATLGRRVKKFGLGLYPLGAVKFPLSYTTMKPERIRYVPLGHEEEMDAPRILAEHKKGQQYGHIIKGHPVYPVYLDAEGKVMALIPIVNSADTGRVDETTRDIFIEVSGMDENACGAALNILVCTFADMGGEIFEVLVDYGARKAATPDLSDREVRLGPEDVNRALGTDFGERDIKALLARMGYSYSGGVVRVPPYRADILGPIDVIEDAAIAYGYNRFKPSTPGFFTPGNTIKDDDIVDSVMRGMGFMEAKTFILTNRERLAAIGQDEGLDEISNPSTADFTVVRPTLLLDMLDTFRTNKMKGLPQRYYEIGIVRSGGRTSRRLAFGVMDRKLEFSHMRGYLQTLAKERGFVFSLEKKENAALDPETSCAVVVDGAERGVLGRVSGSIMEKLGVSFDIYVCELQLGEAP